MNSAAWVTYIIAFLLCFGSVVALLGSIGLLRYEYFYQRIHGASLISSLASLCLLLASMLFFSCQNGTWLSHELLIVFFLALSVPVINMMLIRAAIYRDLAKRAEGG